MMELFFENNLNHMKEFEQVNVQPQSQQEDNDTKDESEY